MKKLFDKITKDSYFLKGTIGLMLCLFAIFGALNRGYVSSFITWIIAFFFGWFFYVFYLIVFLVGIRLLFAKKEFKFHWGITIAGLIVCLVGCLILATNNITGSNNENMLTFKNFGEEFSKSVQGFPVLNYNQISGGFFGFLFVALLNSAIKYVGTNIVGGVLLGAGVILVFIKSIIRLVKHIKEYKNRNIKKMESEFKEANDQTAFTTTQIMENSRATTVITPDAEIAKENTQSIAIQNPNGGVGVGLTSINRAPTGLKKAKFSNVDLYETNDETTTLEEKPVISTPVEQTYDPTVGNTTHIEKDEVIKNDDIPVAKPANFKEHHALNEETVRLAKSPYEKLDGAALDEKKNTPKAQPNKQIHYNYPPLNLLTDRASNMNSVDNIEVCQARRDLLNEIFQEFDIRGKVVSYTIGPVVTRYDIEMDRGETSKVIEKYLNDIAAKLGGIPCRFVSVIEGRTTSGLEIANKKGSLVNFKDCLKNLSREPGTEFLVPFGKDINGNFIQADLKDFPHLLVCGTTGSGKSVFMHSLLMTLIMRNNLNSLKLVIIDPKRVEFNKYKNIPFLLCNPINVADEACLVMNELCNLMEERYDLFDESGVENLKQYNKYLVDHGKPILPRIVVLIDEYADLVGENKRLQEPVQRLAQKARACGIHLIIATQRPSVNVITGVIKGNIPTRVALLCSSVSDSTVILSQGGAEKLLGNGDMLVMSPLISKTGLTRVQGSYVDNAEIKNVCDYLRDNYGPMFDERFVDMKQKSQLDTSEMQEVSYDKAASDEEKYVQVREDIMRREYASLSYIQRTYAVGFPKAGKMITRLINEGVISSEAEGNKGYKVLLHSVTPEERTGSVEQSTFVPNKNNYDE